MPIAASPQTAAKNVLEQFIADGDTPGIQYAIFQSRQSLFEFSDGLADIKSRKKMTADKTLMAYSMTKTITAAAVLMLIEDKRVELDSPVRKYLPDFAYGEKVLVRHLLAQTSGIPNPIPLRWVHLASEQDGPDEQAALSQVTGDNPKLSFEPGEKYGYSNISYWYLGELVARVSGIPFQRFVRDRVFTPLGISESEMAFAIPELAQHSKGYLKKWSLMNAMKAILTDSKFWGDYEDGWLEILPHYPYGPGFGGIIGNVKGFKKFLQDELDTPSILLSPEMKKLFYQQQLTNDGNPISMTLGWHMDKLNGVHYFYKEGGGAGYHGEMRLYPSKGTASVMLTNSTGFNSRKSLSLVDSHFLRP